MFVRNAFDYLTAGAGRSPEKTAFSEAAGGVTFRELLCRAESVGTALADMGCRPGEPVAVLCERSVDAICAFMGALAAGCFYVPLDRKMPEKRLKGILERLSPAAVLCVEAGDLAKAEGSRTALVSELYACEARSAALSDRRRRVLDTDPVNMIFTSGSTGEPKGIVIPHRALVDFVEWMAPTCGIDHGDVMGNQAPFYFDLSVKDIWLTLRCAATAHILPAKCFLFHDGLLRDPGKVRARDGEKGHSRRGGPAGQGPEHLAEGPAGRELHQPIRSDRGHGGLYILYR